jgi:hypothetical protein
MGENLTHCGIPGAFYPEFPKYPAFEALLYTA